MALRYAKQVGEAVAFQGAEGRAAYWLAVRVGPDARHAPDGSGHDSEAENFPIVVARCEGRLAVQELLSFLSLMAVDPQVGPHRPTLWDMRAHDFGQVGAGFARQLAYALGQRPERQGIRRAFLVESEDGYATMRMFQQLVSGYGIDLEASFLVSYSEAEALKWLCPGAARNKCNVDRMVN